MPEIDEDDLLVPMGTPGGTYEPGVALHTRAYTRLIESIRARLPSETAGALIGTTGDGGGDAVGGVETYVTSVEPLSLVSARLGVTPNQAEWDDLKARLASEGAESRGRAERIVGWFYADPGIGIFPPRIDFATVHATLAPDARLFLLVNPASDRGAFYIWRDGGFVPLGGFYEVVDERGAEAAIPWDGEMPGAADWMRGAVAGARTNAGIGAGGYSLADEAKGSESRPRGSRRARLLAGVVLGLTVTVALVGSLFLFGRGGDGLPAPAQTQAMSTPVATLVSTVPTAGEATSVPTPSETAVLPTATMEASATSTPTVAIQPTPTVVTYTVKRGDTLTLIAIGFGTTPEAIMAANGLKDTVITVGQVLIIPGPASPQTATPVATPGTLSPTGTEALPHPVPSAISTVVSR